METNLQKCYTAIKNYNFKKYYISFWDLIKLTLGSKGYNSQYHLMRSICDKNMNERLTLKDRVKIINLYLYYDEHCCAHV